MAQQIEKNEEGDSLRIWQSDSLRQLDVYSDFNHGDVMLMTSVSGGNTVSFVLEPESIAALIDHLQQQLQTTKTT